METRNRNRRFNGAINAASALLRVARVLFSPLLVLSTV